MRYIYPSVHPSVFQSIFFLSVEPTQSCPSVYPYISPSSHLSLCLTSHPFFYLLTFPYGCPFVYLWTSIYPLNHLSLCPPTHAFIHPSVYLSTHLNI